MRSSWLASSAAASLTVLVAILVPSLAWPQSTSRGTDLLARAARLQLRDGLLSEALNALQARSGVPLAFSPALIPRRRVTCACENLNVEETLRLLLDGTRLEFVLRGDRVVIVPPDGAPDSGSAIEIVVTVRDSTNGRPVRHVRVELRERLVRGSTGADGQYTLPDLPPGEYTLIASAIGFRRKEIALVVRHRGPMAVEMLLAPVAVTLEDIIVTPGTFSVLDDARTPSYQGLTREEVQTRPHLGEDIYRAVDRLPGITTDDITAKFHVRGGPPDQVLVLFDGLELYEPFHLKDFDGAISIIDVESVGSIDLITGGFSSEYGDRLAGVFAMKSIQPTSEQMRTAVGLSIQNLTFISQDRFAGGQGSWLVSARRGYLDIIFKITGEQADVSPSYYDVFAKLQFQLSPNHLLSGRVLHGGDQLHVRDERLELQSSWSSSYGWLTWDADWNRIVSTRTILSAGKLTRFRTGFDFSDYDDAQRLFVDDNSDFHYASAQQDLTVLLSDNAFTKLGWTIRSGVADYDYFRWSRTLEPNFDNPFAAPLFPMVDTVAVTTRPKGHHLAAYASQRVRPLQAVTTEVGIRYDHHSHTGDNSFGPRVNVALDLGRRTTLRGAWGLFHQSQRLHELDTPDGQDRFRSAQRAEHRVVGVEHRLADDTRLRVEAYQRLVTDPRPEYRRLARALEAFPEDWADRVLVEPSRGAARGLEFIAKRDVGGRFAWSASYGLAIAEDEIDGQWTPRPLDQRHSINLELAYRPNSRWGLSVAWLYHSPWPVTPQTVTLDTLATGDLVVSRTFGSLYSDRLPAYHRLDVRVSRHTNLGRGRLSVFLDVFNLYDRENATAYQYNSHLSDQNQRFTVNRGMETLLGILPSIGARWEF